jgi:hypothetical protein
MTNLIEDTVNYISTEDNSWTLSDKTIHEKVTARKVILYGKVWIAFLKGIKNRIKKIKDKRKTKLIQKEIDHIESLESSDDIQEGVGESVGKASKYMKDKAEKLINKLKSKQKNVITLKNLGFVYLVLLVAGQISKINEYSPEITIDMYNTTKRTKLISYLEKTTK